MRVLLLLFLALGLGSCAAPTARYATLDVPVDSGSASAMISRHRAAHGLGPVAVDTRLSRMAAAQARGNAEIGQLSHDVGGGFTARLASFRAQRSYAAENLAAGSATLEATMAQWQRSPEHNQNLLLPQAKQIGIARVDAPESRYKHYWALVLAD